MKGSGRRWAARPDGAGPGRRSRGSRTSIAPPVAACPAPWRSAGSRPERPSMRTARRATVVGSSMRRGVAGTRAAASSRSVRMAPGTARVRACSGVSRTTRRPIGLSSRTTSPTSVTQLRVVIPPRRPSTRKAGTGRPAARTTSRAWTSSVIGALRSVAGSNTETCSVWPAWSPRAASTRGRFRESAGGSASSRVSRRSPEVVRMTRSRRRPSIVPRTSVGPVPGSSEKEKARRLKDRSTVARLASRTDAVEPRRAIWSRPSSRIS